MGDFFFRHKVKRLLADAGITVDGHNPWDFTVYDNRFYRRILLDAHIGAGESYVDGWWDCPQLDEFFYPVQRAGIDKKVSGLPRFLNGLIGKAINLQNTARAYTVGKIHYNMERSLYRHARPTHDLQLRLLDRGINDNA